MKNNNKGFTLVEVLAAVAILGILSTIGVVTVTNIRKNQEIKFDQTQRALFRQTAKTYFSDNKSMLPNKNGMSNEVYLKDLINENYIDSLLTYNKDSYLIEDSYVLVTKRGDVYTYEPFLYKEVDDVKEVVKPTDENQAEIKYNSYKKDNNTELISDDSTSTHYTNRTVKVNYSIKDEDGISVFQYIVYKNGKKIYESEYISPNSTSADDELTLKASDYEDGTYQIKITVYDQSDCSTTVASDKIMFDRVAPTCTTTKSPNVEWTNKETTVKGTCSDANSGCVENISKKYNTEMNKNQTPGYIYDKAGNSKLCNTISVKIDKTPPSCEVSGESTTWVKGSRTLTTTCSENGTYQSGCTEVSKAFAYTTTAKTATLSNVVKDKAGNSATCKSSVNVYVDNTAPTCTSSGGHTNWIATSRTLKGTCTDNESGCLKAADANGRTYGNDGSVYWVIDWSGNWTNVTPGRVYDKVGNYTDCPANQTVRVDKVPPECTYSGQNTVWTKNNVTITYSGTDAGVGGITGGGTVTYSSGTTSVATIAGYYIQDALGNQRYCPAAHVNVYSDHDKPTCTVVAKKEDASGDTYTENSWTAKNVYTTATCSDTSGSCSTTKEVTTTGVTTNVTDSVRDSWTVKAKGLSYVTWKVYDAAGNGKKCSKFTVKKGVKDRDSDYCDCETYKRCSSAGCASYSYGSWTGGCWLYSSGTHGGYEYRLLDDWGNGYGGACTQTGGRVAGYRRSVTCSQYNRGSSCGCETYKECWHY